MLHDGKFPLGSRVFGLKNPRLLSMTSNWALCMVKKKVQALNAKGQGNMLVCTSQS